MQRFVPEVDPRVHTIMASAVVCFALFIITAWGVGEMSDA